MVAPEQFVGQKPKVLARGWTSSQEHSLLLGSGSRGSHSLLQPRAPPLTAPALTSTPPHPYAGGAPPEQATGLRPPSRALPVDLKPRPSHLPCSSPQRWGEKGGTPGALPSSPQRVRPDQPVSLIPAGGGNKGVSPSQCPAQGSAPGPATDSPQTSPTTWPWNPRPHPPTPPLPGSAVSPLPGTWPLNSLPTEFLSRKSFLGPHNPRGLCAPSTTPRLPRRRPPSSQGARPAHPNPAPGKPRARRAPSASRRVPVGIRRTFEKGEAHGRRSSARVHGVGPVPGAWAGRRVHTPRFPAPGAARPRSPPRPPPRPSDPAPGPRRAGAGTRGAQSGPGRTQRGAGLLPAGVPLPQSPGRAWVAPVAVAAGPAGSSGPKHFTIALQNC